ncbi:MAG: alpha/beta fold hydrolase [Clostridia bacterium]|nr:alpha/beta fold hydrolase [Clostridia bacterium]
MKLSDRAKKILSVVLASLALMLVADLIVTKIVYDSVFCRFDDPGTPPIDEMGIGECERAEFISGDNLLSGWLFSQGEDLVVIAQGINSEASYFCDEAEYFLSEGFSVFIFDMTGSGESSGDSAVGFSQSVYDLRAALDHIENKYVFDDIFLLGHSRGAYAALCMLGDERDIAGVVSINGANSAMEAIMVSSEKRVGAFAYANYPMLWIYQSLLFDRETVSLSCADLIGNSSVPVLVVHAEDDETVPADRGSVMAHRDEIYRNGAEFISVPGGHTSVFEDGDGGANDSLMEKICDFFYKHTEREVSVNEG